MDLRFRGVFEIGIGGEEFREEGVLRGDFGMVGSETGADEDYVYF